jgi:hypothetical protein
VWVSRRLVLQATKSLARYIHLVNDKVEGAHGGPVVVSHGFAVVIGDAFSNCRGRGCPSQTQGGDAPDPRSPAAVEPADRAYWPRLPEWRPTLAARSSKTSASQSAFVQLPSPLRAYLGQRRIASDLLDRRLNSGPSTSRPHVRPEPLLLSPVRVAVGGWTTDSELGGPPPSVGDELAGALEAAEVPHHGHQRGRGDEAHPGDDRASFRLRSRSAASWRKSASMRRLRRVAWARSSPQCAAPCPGRFSNRLLSLGGFSMEPIFDITRGEENVQDGPRIAEEFVRGQGHSSLASAGSARGRIDSTEAYLRFLDDAVLLMTGTTGFARCL